MPCYKYFVIKHKNKQTLLPLSTLNRQEGLLSSVVDTLPLVSVAHTTGEVGTLSSGPEGGFTVVGATLCTFTTTSSVG